MITYGVPIVVRKLFAGVPLLDASAIDEDADLVAISQHLGHERCHGFL